jgi:hypothetical protein
LIERGNRIKRRGAEFAATPVAKRGGQRRKSIERMVANGRPSDPSTEGIEAMTIFERKVTAGLIVQSMMARVSKPRS